MTFVSSFLGDESALSLLVQPYPLNGVLETHTPKKLPPRPRGEVPEAREGTFQAATTSWSLPVGFASYRSSRSRFLSNSISIAFY